MNATHCVLLGEVFLEFQVGSLGRKIFCDLYNIHSVLLNNIKGINYRYLYVW